MFTGLVEGLGHVVSLDLHPGRAASIGIAAAGVLDDAKLGDSIAVNGVCLTVVELGDGRFAADVMAETLDRTALGELGVGSPVNLERAVLATSRLGGHVVQGHVDDVGEIIRIDPTEHWTTLTIAMPGELAGYVAEKGSIAVDGISLTVAAVSGEQSSGSGGRQTDVLPANTLAEQASPARHWFQVSLIPTTRLETTLGGASVGSRVNLEVDVIAKYVERLLAVRQP